jgi:hypothetical protein
MMLYNFTPSAVDALADIAAAKGCSVAAAAAAFRRFADAEMDAWNEFGFGVACDSFRADVEDSFVPAVERYFEDGLNFAGLLADERGGRAFEFTASASASVVSVEVQDDAAAFVPIVTIAVELNTDAALVDWRGAPVLDGRYRLILKFFGGSMILESLEDLNSGMFYSRYLQPLRPALEVREFVLRDGLDFGREFADLLAVNDFEGLADDLLALYSDAGLYFEESFLSDLDEMLAAFADDFDPAFVACDCSKCAPAVSLCFGSVAAFRRFVEVSDLSDSDWLADVDVEFFLRDELAAVLASAGGAVNV